MFPCFQTNVDVVILILQPWLLKVFISESLILATESDNSVRYQANKCWSWYQYLRRIQLCCLHADISFSSSGCTCGQPYQLLWDGASSICFIYYIWYDIAMRYVIISHSDMICEICDMILQILMQFSHIYVEMWKCRWRERLVWQRASSAASPSRTKTSG